MRRALALVRPEPGWSASAGAARALGIEVVGHPLVEAEAVPWELPDSETDALLVGSATTFRLGGPQLARLTDLPVHAVGEATAKAARSAGFRVERIGEGGLQHLLDDAAGKTCRYLRLGGEERITLAPRAAQEIVDCAVYRMRPLPVGPEFAAALERNAPLVALHSAAAARHFGAEIDRLNIARGRLFAIALGPRIAKAAGLGWAALHIVDTPDDTALLAKAAALCK